MHVYLETERLILRRLTMDDLDNLVAMESDPEVMRYLTGGPPTPRDVLVDDILPAWLEYYEHGDRYGFWAAVEKASGRFLGWFHLRPAPGTPDDEPELGYRLRRDSWGKGYGTEGSLALIDKAFTELGARRVVASTYEDNVGSRRVMEKCGMTFVRSFRMTEEELAYHGAPTDIWEKDDVEYAITKEDWERHQPRAS